MSTIIQLIISVNKLPNNNENNNKLNTQLFDETNMLQIDFTEPT